MMNLEIPTRYSISPTWKEGETNKMCDTIDEYRWKMKQALNQHPPDYRMAVNCKNIAMNIITTLELGRIDRGDKNESE